MVNKLNDVPRDYNKEGETATTEEFIAYFKERLTPYKVPSEVEFRAELPKSMIGKILRRATRGRKSQGGENLTPQGRDRPNGFVSRHRAPIAP